MNTNRDVRARRRLHQPGTHAGAHLWSPPWRCDAIGRRRYGGHVLPSRRHGVERPHRHVVTQWPGRARAAVRVQGSTIRQHSPTGSIPHEAESGQPKRPRLRIRQLRQVVRGRAVAWHIRHGLPHAAVDIQQEGGVGDAHTPPSHQLEARVDTRRAARHPKHGLCVHRPQAHHAPVAWNPHQRLRVDGGVARPVARQPPPHAHRAVGHANAHQLGQGRKGEGARHIPQGCAVGHGSRRHQGRQHVQDTDRLVKPRERSLDSIHRQIQASNRHGHPSARRHTSPAADFVCPRARNRSRGDAPPQRAYQDRNAPHDPTHAYPRGTATQTTLEPPSARRCAAGPKPRPGRTHAVHRVHIPGRGGTDPSPLPPSGSRALHRARRPAVQVQLLLCARRRSRAHGWRRPDDGTRGVVPRHLHLPQQ